MVMMMMMMMMMPEECFPNLWLNAGVRRISLLEICLPFLSPHDDDDDDDEDDEDDGVDDDDEYKKSRIYEKRQPPLSSVQPYF